MAALIRDSESGSFKVTFRFCGTQYKWSLRHDDAILANETLSRVERTLRDLDECGLVMPEGTDVGQFVKTDGGRHGPLKLRKRR
jgi:hypothetical protein